MANLEAIAKAEATFTTTGQETDEVALRGDFNVSITGTWSGIIDLQRSFDDGSTFNTLSDGSFTSSEDKVALNPEPAIYKLVATAISSGSATVRISQ